MGNSRGKMKRGKGKDYKEKGEVQDRDRGGERGNAVQAGRGKWGSVGQGERERERVEKQRRRVGMEEGVGR